MRKIEFEKEANDQKYFPRLQKLEQCTKATHKPKGIPNEYYTKIECSDLERDILFNKGWFAVGFVKDLPQIGSVAIMIYEINMDK